MIKGGGEAVSRKSSLRDVVKSVAALEVANMRKLRHNSGVICLGVKSTAKVGSLRDDNIYFDTAMPCA